MCGSIEMRNLLSRQPTAAHAELQAVPAHNPVALFPWTTETYWCGKIHGRKENMPFLTNVRAPIHSHRQQRLHGGHQLLSTVVSSSAACTAIKSSVIPKGETGQFPQSNVAAACSSVFFPED